jgi:hypothetical protein
MTAWSLIGTMPVDQEAPSAQVPPPGLDQRTPASATAISTAARAWISPAPESLTPGGDAVGIADCANTAVSCIVVRNEFACSTNAAVAAAFGAAAEVPPKGANPGTAVSDSFGAANVGIAVSTGCGSGLPFMSNNRLPGPTLEKPSTCGGETPKAGVCAQSIAATEFWSVSSSCPNMVPEPLLTFGSSVVPPEKMNLNTSPVGITPPFWLTTR